MSRPLHFAVSGYYGCGNAGDEAVLAGIAASFRRQAGERVRLTVLSQNPEATTAQHGLPAVHRMKLDLVAATLKECDLLLSGGGSLLQDTTSVRSLIYYLWIARMAFKAGKPVMFYAQGMGPLRRPISRLLVRLVANRATFLTVRDEPSAALLKRIGVTNPRLEVTADPAFALSPTPDEQVDALFARHGIPVDTPLVGVALRPWGTDSLSTQEGYARLVVELHQQTGATVVLVPMHSADDIDFARQVAERTGQSSRFPLIAEECAPELLLGALARMQAVVAMRLHALIFAARMGVPPFALAYDPKVENLMSLLGLSDALVPWDTFDPAAVAARVAIVLQHRAEHVAALQSRAATLERRALRTADIALELFKDA